MAGNPEREILAVKRAGEYWETRKKLLRELLNVCSQEGSEDASLVCERGAEFYKGANDSLIEVLASKRDSFLGGVLDKVRGALREVLSLEATVVGSSSADAIKVACVTAEDLVLGGLRARRGSILMLSPERALLAYALGLVSVLKMHLSKKVWSVREK
ncbi:MAG: hypothetical protein QXU97_02940 [Fervidicoccaceae archaeon]